MGPNQQPQDFNKLSEPAENPAPEFGAQQPEFSQPTLEPTPAPTQEAPVAPAFGQPIEASEQSAPQPAISSPEPSLVGQAPVHQGDNPGQLFGIISIVLSFLGLSVIGIILGVISRKKSKAVGASTILGTIGLIIGIVFTIIGFLFFLLITLVAYGGIQDRSKQTSALVSANSVEKRAEAYYANTGAYPATIADFEKGTSSSLSDVDAAVGTTTPTDYKTIKYVQCSEDGAQVSYFDPTTETVVIQALGTASSVTAC